MAQVNISNTFWNDTSTGTIAFSEQLKERLLKDYIATLSELDRSRIPSDIQDISGVFQARLNEFFLAHYVAYEHFLHDVDLADETINTWKELEEFLAGISDSEGITLLRMVADIQIKSGQLNVRMSDEVPGLVEAVTVADIPMITESHIDDTGAINMVYTFN